MKLCYDEILTVTITLFAVIDIIGALPVIISLKQKNMHIQPYKATLVAVFLMLLFLFAGEQCLAFIGLDIPSFAIAGSIVIFIIAIEMILGISLFKEEAAGSSGSVVPIAFPILAGSGTLTTIMSMKSVYQMQSIVISIIINCLLIWGVLNITHVLEKYIGKNGLMVVRKFFGVILLAIAVKIFKTNF